MTTPGKKRRHDSRNSRERRRRASRRMSAIRRAVFETLERRDLLSTLDWSAGPALPAPRTDAVAVVTPDRAVRLLGGDAADPFAAPLLAANASSWTFGQRIDTQRNDLGAVTSGSEVILFGGTGGTEGINEVLSYDYRAGDSQDLAKMSQLRYDLAFAADGSGRAYALGGIGVYGDGQVWSTAERYDPATRTWSSIASLPVPLHGATAIGDGNGHLFVFGGSTTLDDTGIQAATYRYDVATDTWKEMAPLPTATRDSAAAIDATGAIYVTGGMTTSGATAAVQKYDPSTNAWTAETPLPAAVYSHAATFDSRGEILVAGGFDASGAATAAVYHTQNLNVPDTVPVITTSPVVDGSLDKPYQYDVNASGNPIPTYSLVDAPSGMTIDSATGLITWQPIDGQLGVHTVTARASNRAGNADQTFQITVVADTIAPTVPTNLAASNITETTATLDWTASTDAVGVDHYEVFAVTHHRRRSRRWVTYAHVATVPATTQTATISGLAPLSYHGYVVRAVDAAGNASPYSSEVSVVTLAAPDLRFRAGSQTSGVVSGRVNAPLEIQLLSRANPAATFSIVSGPAAMTVDPNSGLVQWTPAVADVGAHTATFRATNSVGSADLTVSLDVVPDAPVLSVVYNPNGGGDRFAVAGTLFEAQVNDASSTPPTYSLVAAPSGMSINADTGLISWTPTASQAGTPVVTVRATNAGGATDLTFNVPTLFTDAVTGVHVTGTTLLAPTAHWVAPTGEGAGLIDHYEVTATANYRVGISHRVSHLSYTVPAAATQVELTGLLAGKRYLLAITPVDAAGNRGRTSAPVALISTPLLPQVTWTVDGKPGGSSVPGIAVPNQPTEIVLLDHRLAPSTLSLVSGPAGVTFDPTTNKATWTPTAADVTPGASTIDVTFRATNSVGSVDVVVPIRVFFSSPVTNPTATRYGRVAEVRWSPPANHVRPIAGYKIRMVWRVHNRTRSRSWTVGNVDHVAFSLTPTGAVWHQGVTITPLDAAGNEAIGSPFISYADPPNNLAPIAVDDRYDATEDTPLTVDAAHGVRANDIDTDHTPYFNPLTIQVVQGPAHGQLNVRPTGAFTYTPDADFNGTETFTYRAYDGKFASNVATATINVAPVNDAPVALDDYFDAVQDQPLVVDAASGVLANDSDVDGDPLSAALVTRPANGTIAFLPDGSFSYTPNAGFAGTDTFTYVTSDGTVDSRVATANIAVAPPAGGTKFYVVDLEVRNTFQYTATGELAGNYKLAAANRKPHGATASKDGSKLWVLDKKGKVYLYDANGAVRGVWTPTGPKKFDGIATDDTNIWIVDRELDRVFYYAGAAARTSGTAAATSSFALDAANRRATGITSDGQSLWVVDDATTDRVFKYRVDGTFLGSWAIDQANTRPSGITIDPNDINHLWIVDSRSDQVYQYRSATGYTSGQHAADARFALTGSNVDPQGIADPPAALQTWTNPFDRFDVNDDHRVTPLDALALVNELNTKGPHQLGSANRASAFFDVNDDGTLSPVDVLAVVQALDTSRFGKDSATDTALLQVADELATGDSTTVADSALAELLDPAPTDESE